MSATSFATPLFAGQGHSLPGNAELDAAIRAVAVDAGQQAELRQVGASRSGRPIMMLSLGEGDRSALIVGGPHPNEPIGGTTVIRLARQLASDEGLRRRLGYRWHFIGSIDPDGLEMNDGWLRGERTLGRYYSHFFRPAFDRQPEYTFPLEEGSYRFDRSTPENRAWRQALELTRPAYQVSLHSAEYGGVFYLTSRDLPALTKELVAYPESVGLTINRFGEPFSELSPIAPGVFSFMDLAGMVKAAGERAAEIWPAGDSSASYSASRYGTFNLVCEVPLWDDARLRDTSLSPFSLGDVMSRQRQRLSSALERIGPDSKLIPAAEGDAEELLRAITEFTDAAPKQGAHLERLQGLRDWSAPLPVRDFAVQDTILAIAAIRPVAMLSRLASLAGNTDMANKAREWVKNAVRDIESQADLAPLSVERIAAVQIHAVLKGAEAARSL